MKFLGCRNVLRKEFPQPLKSAAGVEIWMKLLAKEVVAISTSFCNNWLSVTNAKVIIIITGSKFLGYVFLVLPVLPK